MRWRKPKEPPDKLAYEGRYESLVGYRILPPRVEPPSQRRDLRGFVFVWTVVLLVLAVWIWKPERDPANIRDSPFAALIVDCPEGWKEQTAGYVDSVSSTGSMGAGKLTVTSQLCVEHNPPRWLSWIASPSDDAFRRWVTIRTFASDETAHSFILNRHPPVWPDAHVQAGYVQPYPAPPFGEEALRVGASSSVSECLYPDPTDPAPCWASDSLLVRVGRVVVLVTGEDGDAHICGPCLRYDFGTGVSGNTRQVESEEIMRMLVAGVAHLSGVN